MHHIRANFHQLRHRGPTIRLCGRQEVVGRRSPPICRRLRYASLSSMIIAGALTAQAQLLSPSPQMIDVRRGEHVVLHANSIPMGDVKVVISKDGAGDGGAPVTIDTTNKTLTFLVDPALSPGRYLAKLLVNGSPEPIPGELRVLRDSDATAHIDNIYPSVRYPGEIDGIEIVGSNFSPVATDNVVEMLDQEGITFGTEKDCVGPTYPEPCVQTIPGMEGHRIRIVGLQKSLKSGITGIRIRVGQTAWSNVMNVTTAPKSISAIRMFAFAVLVIVGLLAYLLAKRAAKTQTPGTGLTAVSVLLLDAETDTYSLSKLQMLVWTGIFVFTYVYLVLCRTLVQWRFEWPPVPNNMPELLGISAGAGVVAAGISSLKGTKGAGGLRPSAADFITTGGVVAGERLQFFVWTIVGALVFLYIVLRANPASLQELPTIPDTFLYLMGFSSAAYLGGKLARKPGPVVKNISVQNVRQLGAGDAEMTILIEGENLHQNATFLIDGQQIRAGQFSKITTKPEKPQDGFCTSLEIVITQAAKYTDGTHTLTVANPDGQSAAIAFPVSPLTITEVNKEKADATGVDLRVKGANFVGNILAEWTSESGGVPISGTVDRLSDSELKIRFQAGTTGSGKLALTSSVGLRRTFITTIA